MKARTRRRNALVAILAIGICAFSFPLAAGGTAVGRKAAISTVSPAATRIGLAVMRSGGNAADAAVAVAFALSVIHPQAGNLGGGGFLVYYDASTRGVWTLDFREVAPKGASRTMYEKAPDASRNGALASGVPGSVAGLGALHERFGSKGWKSLLDPALHLAREGFVADPQLLHDLEQANQQRKLTSYSATTSLYFDDGKPKTKIAPADLASTLQRISEGGSREFYRGAIAEKLVEALRRDGGIIGFRDLAEYQPQWRAALKLGYGAFDIYAPPPPSAGGIVIGEALNILAGDDLPALGFQTPAAIHLLVEAQRRAAIDRNRYLSDPVGARIPVRDLLSRARAEEWRRTILKERVVATSALAEPSGSRPEGENTTHFTIADPEGNVIALTTSLGENFGSGYVVPGLGFFLNNAMDDFTTAKDRPNRDGLVQGIGNTIEPGRIPLSSLSPVIILRGAKPFLALGTSGGAAIPTTVLQVILNVTAYGKSLPDAIAAPRYHHQAIPEEMSYERGRAPSKTIDALNAMGHGVTERESIGDVHAILFEKGKLTAVADPRNGGAAGGF